MITFKYIEFSNFLSAGKQPIKFKLDEYKTSLICGVNGSGKSTLIDALHYCLFGKAYRNINNSQLINTVNKKKLYVKVSFKNKNEYTIVRGQKPNIFNIFKNGELIEQPASIRDYQAILEDILGFNAKSFSQVVILGSANYKPFMQLTAQERRILVEDLFDIRIFDAMNKIAKSKLSVERSSMDNIENQIFLKESEIDKTKELNDKIKTGYKNLIKEETNKVNDLNNKIEKLEEEISSLSKEKDDIVEVDKKDVDKLEKEISKLNSYNHKFIHKIEDVNNDIKFFSANSSCPTCKREIDEQFKSKMVTELNSKNLKLDEGYKKLLEELNQSKTEKEELEEKLSKLNDIVYNIKNFSNEISTLKNQIKGYQKSIEDLENKSKSSLYDIESLETELAELNLQKKDISKKMYSFKVIIDLLKDDGVKRLIIEKYLPLLNSLIEHNLNILDFNCNFSFDEKFKEIIKSRGKDLFSYDSFSEGEKFRIDLSVLFAFREIAVRRGSLNTNLLILDEIGGSSLDENGFRQMLKLVKHQKDTNTIFISHQVEQIQDNVDMIYNVKKSGHFTVVSFDK